MNIPCRRRPLNAYMSQQLNNTHIVGSSDYSNLSKSHNIDNKLVPIKPEEVIKENNPPKDIVKTKNKRNRK